MKDVAPKPQESFSRDEMLALAGPLAVGEELKAQEPGDNGGATCIYSLGCCGCDTLWCTIFCSG